MDEKLLTNEERAKLGYSNIPGEFNTATGQAISLDTLNSNEKPVVTPEPTPTIPTPITLSGGTSPEAQAEIDKIKAQKQTEVGGITGILKELGVEQGKEAQYATEAGADEAQRKYTEFSNQLAAEQRALELAKRDLSNKGLTQSQVQTSSDALERQSLQKQADIAILGNAAKGDFDTAMSIAQRKVESAVAPLKAELEAKKFIYESNKELFSKAEGAKLESLLTQEENRIAREEKTLDTIESIKLEAAKNGLTNFSGFDKVKTVDEALNLAGSYLKSVETEIRQLEDGNTVVVDRRTGKIINTLGGAKGTGIESGKLTPEFSSIVSRTAAMEGTVAGKESIANDLTRYLTNQDYSSAYNQIENTVANGLTGTTKTTFSDARIDAEILKGLRSKIQDFENAGGDTGLLKGTAEQITRKLGEVKDPALASLAVELTREFQKYRVGMTGAAFSPKESRDYASVNPKTTNKFDLNMAVIDGAISQLDNRVNSTVDSIIKGAGDIRTLADIPKTTQEAKKQIETFYARTDDATAKIIDNLYNSGKFDDTTMLEYLKTKGIIKN